MWLGLNYRTVATLILMTACSAPDSEPVEGPQFFAGLSSVRTVTDGDDSRGSWSGNVLTTRAVVGPGALGRPTVGAVDAENGHLLIGDATSCTIKRYRLNTLEFVDSLGRCGEGPGEVRFVGGILVSHAAIMVIDYGGKRIVSFDRGGTEINRRLMPSIEQGRWLYRIIGVSHDTLTGLWAAVGSTKDEDADVVARDIRGVRPAGARLRQPPVAALNPGLINGLGGCQSSGPSPGHVVVVSSWAVESVVLDRESLEPEVRSAQKVPWDTTIVPEGETGPVSPMSSIVAVCGPSAYAALWVSKPDGSDMQHVRLEVRDYAGRLLLRRANRVRRDADRLVPVALDDSRLYVVTADTSGYPLVAAIDLTEKDEQ